MTEFYKIEIYTIQQHYTNLEKQITTRNNTLQHKNAYTTLQQSTHMRTTLTTLDKPLRNFTKQTPQSLTHFATLYNNFATV